MKIIQILKSGLYHYSQVDLAEPSIASEEIGSSCKWARSLEIIFSVVSSFCIFKWYFLIAHNLLAISRYVTICLLIFLILITLTSFAEDTNNFIHEFRNLLKIIFDDLVLHYWIACSVNCNVGCSTVWLKPNVLQVDESRTKEFDYHPKISINSFFNRRLISIK